MCYNSITYAIKYLIMKNILSICCMILSFQLAWGISEDPGIGNKSSTPVRMVYGLPEEVSIYPNPAMDYFFLVATTENIYFNHITIKDVNGRLLKEWPLPHHTPHIRIDVEDLPMGMYIAQIHTNGVIYNTKVFKARRS